MKFGLTFGLVQVPGMPLTYEQSVADLVSGARDAEELGYDAVHMVEHHFQPDGYNPSPLITLAAAAAVTERVALGTNILLVPLYNPMKLAEDVAVLDNLSHGRLVLGVAPGYVQEEFAGLMVPYEERFKRFEEALDLMQLAWKGEPFSFSGRFFEVPETRLSPAPVQAGGPPLWYGVSGPRLLRRAARRGAALAISPRHTVAEVREHLRQYEEHCDEFGVHPNERPAMREVFVAETREEAERIAAPAVTHLFKELVRQALGQGRARADVGHRRGRVRPRAGRLRQLQAALHHRDARRRRRGGHAAARRAGHDRAALLDAHAGDRGRGRDALCASVRARGDPRVP